MVPEGDSTAQGLGRTPLFAPAYRPVIGSKIINKETPICTGLSADDRINHDEQLIIFRRPPGRRDVIKEIMNYLSAGLPAGGKSLRKILRKSIIIFPPASPAGGKSSRSGSRPRRTPPFRRPPGRREIIKENFNHQLFSAGLPPPPTPSTNHYGNH